jgi:oligoendopeptidase F
MASKTPTSWDFTLLYKSDTDPQIEKDMKAVEQAFATFATKYQGKDFASSPARLLAALKDYERLESTLHSYKPYFYFSRRKDVESEHKLASMKLAQFEQRIQKAANQIVFFRLALGKVPARKQKELLRRPDFKPYAYFLKVLFEQAKYNLSESEEQLAALLSQPASSMWMESWQKLLSAQTISFKGKKLPISRAVEMLSQLPKKERYALHDLINKKVESVSHVAEAEINALFNYKKIMDERRGFARPYSATVLSYENDEASIESLVKAVTKSFGLSRRFFKLQAKLLGEKKLRSPDRNVPIGKIEKKLDYEASIALIKQAFAKVGPAYPELVEQAVREGRIDLYPKQGKRGGAYCAGGDGVPTLVFANFIDNVKSYETLAHEFGHFFHTELSKRQPILYRGYSIAVAEVASTFFEQVALHELEGTLSPEERIILMHTRLQTDISTIFAQIAYFNFELEIHERIRKEGFVAKEELAKIVAKHLRAYAGEAVEITDQDGYFFARIPHLRYFFYVYSYAYGQLISRVLFEKWKEDKGYAKKIEQFLSAGSSMSPKDIFKSIGIDTSDPKFFEAGLKAIERDIAKLERLTKRKG